MFISQPPHTLLLNLKQKTLQDSDLCTEGVKMNDPFIKEYQRKITKPPPSIKKIMASTESYYLEAAHKQEAELSINTTNSVTHIYSESLQRAKPFNIIAVFSSLHVCMCVMYA